MHAFLRQVLLVAAALGVVTPLCGQSRAPGAESKWTGVRVLELEKVVRIEDGRLLEERQRFVGEVLDAAGRTSLSQVLIFYPEETGEARLERLERRRPDGTVQDLLVDAPQDVAPVIPPVLPIYSDLRVLRTAVPALEVGDVLIFEYRSSTRPVTRHDLWYEHEFADSELVEGERFVLDVAEDSTLQVRVDETAVEPVEERREGGRWIRAWTRRPAVELPVDGEPAPFRADIQVSSFADWQEIGVWWLELGSTQVTEAIRSKAEELTAGLETPRARFDSIHRFVSQEIRYLSLPLGVGRFEPRPPEEILRTSFGDCKDKHRLLASLAAAVGIEVYPVLISASGRVLDEGIASPAQFDHVVSVARIAGESVWVDSTSELTPSGRLPERLRDVLAVRLPGHGDEPLAELVRTPDSPSFPDSTIVETTGEITADGDIRARVRWTIHGDAERYRRAFRYASPERQRSLIRRWNSKWKKEYTRIGEIRSGEPTDLDSPFWYEFDVTWTMGRQVWDQDWEIWLPVPEISLEGPPENLDEDDETGQSLKFRTPCRQIVTARISLPEGSTATPPLPVDLERSFATYRSNYRFEDGALVEERELNCRTGSVARADSQELRAFRKIMENERLQKFEVSARPDLVSESEGPADRLYRVGGVAFEEGRPEEAITLFEQAVELDPQHSLAWNGLGLALHEVGRLDEARRAFERQIEISPNDSTIYGNLALLYWHEGDLDRAEELLRQQIDVAPLESFGMRTLGHLLLMQDEDEEAEQWLRRARRANPKDDETTFLLMWLGLKSGDSDEANELAKAHPGVPEELRYRFVLADFLVLDSIEAWPGFEGWADHLARRASSLLGDFEGGPPSVEHMKAVLALAAAWDIRGRLEVERRQFEAAERDLSSSYFLSQAPPTAAWLSKAVRGTGETEMADLYLARAVISNPRARSMLEEEWSAAAADPNDRSRLEDLAEEMSWRLRRVSETVSDAGGAQGRVWLVYSPNGDLEEAFPEEGTDLAPLASRLKEVGLSMPFPLDNTSRIPIRAEADCSMEGVCSIVFESLTKTIRPFLEPESGWGLDSIEESDGVELAP